MSGLHRLETNKEKVITTVNLILNVNYNGLFLCFISDYKKIIFTNGIRPRNLFCYSLPLIPDTLLSAVVLLV